MSGTVHYFRWPWEIITGPTAPESGARVWSSSGLLGVPAGSTLTLQTRNAQYVPMEGGRFCLFALPLTSEAVSFDVAVPGEAEVSRWTLAPPPLFSQIPPGKTARELDLYDLILSWSTFFDECVLNENGKAALSWEDVGRTLLRPAEDTKEPQMSLIVRIAREMHPTVSELSGSVRSILSRERLMVPAGRVEEFDPASIQWLGRQPGQNLAEKAAYNRQKLKSVTRRQFFDTLENRVFKDFLARCQKEAGAYLRGCTQEQRRSNRALDVDRFGKLCATVLGKPLLQKISPVHWGAVQPNYVLQSDPRYRKLWRDYCLLLRRQRAADSLWSWQARLWSDVVAATLGVALEQWKKEGGAWEAISYEGFPSIDFEQRQGRRLASETLPGPYLAQRCGSRLSADEAFVLEAVHDDLLRDFAQARRLRGAESIRAATTLVLTPLSGRRPLLAAFWPVHTLADGERDTQAMRESLCLAQKALENTSGLQVFGIALVNTGTPGVESCSPWILRLNPERSAWPENVRLVSAFLQKELFPRVVSR